MSFSRLLDDLARERDRRAYDRDVAMTVDRIRFGGRPFHNAMSSLTGQLRSMAKAMTVDLAQARTTQRQDAIDRLADINARATALAASGQLSGHEGALLDGAIARAADRIRGL